MIADFADSLRPPSLRDRSALAGWAFFGLETGFPAPCPPLHETMRAA